MDDVAVLGFSVDSRELDQGSKALDKLEISAKKAETSASRMEKLVTAAFKAIGAAARSLLSHINSLDRAFAVLGLAHAAASGGIKHMAFDLVMAGREFRKAEKDASGYAKALRLVKVALASIGISLGVSQLIQYSDTYGMLQSQLALVTDSSRELTTVWNGLYASAQQSAQSLDASANLYAKLARSSRELGASQKQLLEITDSINKSLLISRVPAASSSAALFQLSQAMASGVLRGEELNSILEQVPRLAEAIAHGLGTTIGALRKMGEQGELTSKKVVQALLNQREAIEAEFGSVFITVSNAMARVDNVMIQLIGRADEVGGASLVIGEAIAQMITRLEKPETLNAVVALMEKLAVVLRLATDAILFMVDHLDTLLMLFIAFKAGGAIWGAVQFIGAWRAAVWLANGAAAALGATLGTTTKALIGFSAAMRFAGIIGIAVSALAALAGYMLLTSANASAAEKALDSHRKSLAELGSTYEEVTAKVRQMTEAQKEAAKLRIGEAIAEQVKAQAEALREAEKILSKGIRDAAGGGSENRASFAGLSGRTVSEVDPQAQKQLAELRQQMQLVREEGGSLLEVVERFKSLGVVTGEQAKELTLLAEQVDNNQIAYRQLDAQMAVLEGRGTALNRLALGSREAFLGMAGATDEARKAWESFLRTIASTEAQLGTVQEEMAQTGAAMMTAIEDAVHAQAGNWLARALGIDTQADEILEKFKTFQGSLAEALAWLKSLDLFTPEQMAQIEAALGAYEAAQEKVGGLTRQLNAYKEVAETTGRSTAHLVAAIEEAYTTTEKAEKAWAKFIGKLEEGRDTVGMLKHEEVEYQATALALEPILARRAQLYEQLAHAQANNQTEQVAEIQAMLDALVAHEKIARAKVAYAVALQKQTDALEDYQDALVEGDRIEAEKLKNTLDTLAQAEAVAAHMRVYGEELLRFTKLAATGMITMAQATFLALTEADRAYEEHLKAARARLAKLMEGIEIRAPIIRAERDDKNANKDIEQYQKWVKEKEADIKAEIALAEAYLQGREAVEAATKARKIEQEVLKHGEKHRAEIVKLLGAEADARKRSELAKAALDITEETSDIQAHARAILEGTAALEEYNLQKEIAAAMAKKSAEGAEAEAEAIRRAARARAEAARGLDAAEEARRLVEATATPLEQYNKRLAELDGWYKEITKGKPVSPEIAEAFRRARLEAEALLHQADPMAQVFKDAASDIHRAWTDLFDGIFDKGIDSFRDLVGSIGAMFKRMLAQMAALALARPILMPVMQTMGTALGVPQGAQAGIMQQMGLGGESGGFNPMSMLTGNSLGAAGSEILRHGATLAYKMGFEGAANTLGQSAMNLSSASNLSLGVGGFAGGMAGNFGANALFGDNRGMGASIGGAVGGTAGAIAGQILIPIPVVGAFIGSTIGSFLGNAFGGLFGGKSPKARLGTSSGTDNFEDGVFSTGAFGNVGFVGDRTKRIDADEFKQAFDAIAQLDNALASALNPEQFDSVKRELDGFVSSREKGEINLERLAKERLGKIMEAIGGNVAAFADRLDDLSLENAYAMVQAIVQLDNSLESLTADLQSFGKSAADAIRQMVDQWDSGVSSAMQSLQSAFDSGDFARIAAAAQQAHAAVVQRYQAEIQLATELYNQVRQIAAAARNFELDVAGKINALQPSSEQQNLLTGHLNQALQTAFNPEIQDKPDRQIGELSEALAVLDQWVAASKDAINQAINEQIRGLEDEKRLITDVTRERLSALQEELRLAQQWAGVLSSAKRLIEEMTLTRVSPLPTSVRLSMAESETARLTEAFNGASGEEQVQIGEALLKALESQLTLAQEAFQRPSPEYMDAYNAIIKQVSALEGVAQAEADRAAALQQEISYLNDLQVDLLAGIDAQIDYLREVAEVNLAAVNATAIELYRLIQAEGNRAYAQLEAQAQEQLNVLLQGQTYDQFIAERQAETVSLLTQIRDGIQAALGVDGSHSSGLPYVPHNNYHAVLHEGEQVLTRDEARRYRDRDSQEGEAPAFAPPAARHAPPAPPMNITLAPQISLPAISINGGGDTQEVIREVRRVIARELPEQIKKTTIELLPVIKQKLRSA